MSTALPQPEQPGLSVVVASFEHNTWANLQLLDFCAGLSAEQLDASAVGGYGSIRTTLLHLIRAETRYVERASGRVAPQPLSLEQWPGFEVLRADVRWAGAELLQLALSARTDTRVTETGPQTIEQYKLADLMVQSISHSIEHRTQVATVLTQLGLEPPDLAGWHWMEVKGEFWISDRPASA